mmetsp:Transcript_23960/g.95078  ORF Transcript_23960/g.95078 Transcript_23960/m.95078 type:complete len:207 (-) Transcript_23960:23-643(-)
MSGKRRTEKGVKKGFSLMDWMRLGSHAKDLAGRKGAPLRAISREELAQHASEYDVWTVLDGRVYNLTPYLHYHPGGVKILLQRGVAGADCTRLFTKYHRWVNGRTMLAKCEIGWLDSSGGDANVLVEDDAGADDDDEEDEEEEESSGRRPTPAPSPPSNAPADTSEDAVSASLASVSIGARGSAAPTSSPSSEAAVEGSSQKTSVQ